MSQLAEEHIRRSMEGHATLLDRLGGDAEAAAAAEKFGMITRTVNAALPNNPLRHRATFLAWITAMPELLRPVIDEQAHVDLLEILEVEEACKSVLNLVNAAGPDDHVYRRAAQPFSIGVGLTTIARTERVADVLAQSYTQQASDVVRALEELRAAGETAGAEIDSALVLARRLEMRTRAQTEAIEQANLVGQVIGRQAARTLE
jgi:hypothetical protein